MHIGTPFSITVVAATAFFYAEEGRVTDRWMTSWSVGEVITLLAGVHYMCMREYWGQVHKSHFVYRYIEWSTTVPLQMVESTSS